MVVNDDKPFKATRHFLLIFIHLQLVDNPSNAMRAEVEIHNDYFTCQFVLAFPVAGIHKINITTGNITHYSLCYHLNVAFSFCLIPIIRRIIFLFSEEQKIIASETSFHHAKTIWFHQAVEKCFTYQNLIPTIDGH